MIAWGIPADDLFPRAETLAKQRAQLLHFANSPDYPERRRSLLIHARKVERIIVGIGELAEAACRRERRWGAA